MRTLTTLESKILASNAGAVHVRVKVADAGGTFRDLTDLNGHDYLTGVEIDCDIDMPVDAATVYLAREIYHDQLSFLNQTTRPNLVTGSYAPLITPAAEFYIEMALAPVGTPVEAVDASWWREVFRGDIRLPDFSSDPLKFTARDLGGRLQDLWIETETVYGSTGGTAAQTVMQSIIKDAHGTAWASGQTLALRDRTTPVTQNGYWYRVTTAGTSGTSEPTWGTTIGGTTSASGGTAVWTCYGRVPTLYTPVSPGFNLKKYAQKPMSVLEALRVIAQLTGWDVRYKWRAGTGQFELTYYEPDRSKATVDATFTADQYLSIGNFSVNPDNVRNKVKVSYPDSADLDNSGFPKRKSVTVQDATSQDRYTKGLPHFCEIVESDTSPLNTSTEATTLANRVLADLKDPVAECQFELIPFPVIEIGDRYTFAANNVQHTSDLTLAVTKYRHVLQADGTVTTTVDLRGAPVGAVTDWLRKEAGSQAPAKTATPDAPTNVTATAIQGGIRVTFTPPTATANKKWDSAELHVSTSASFTASSATRVAGPERSTALEASNLTPGTTYYVQVIARDDKGNYSAASSEVSIAAGYTPPRAMLPRVPYQTLPFNSSFEAQTDASAPPDAWAVTAGTWGTGITLDTSNRYSGQQALKITGTGKTLESQLFPVRSDAMFAVEAKVLTTGTATVQVTVNCYSHDGSTLLGTVSQTLQSLTVFRTLYLFANSVVSAGYLSVSLTMSSGGGSDIAYIDDVRVFALNEASGALTYGTNWTAPAAAGYEDAGYYRDFTGRVHLFGWAKNTNTANTVIGNLPAGYRPSKNLPFGTSANDAFFSLEVKSNGDINCRSTPVLNQNHSLNGISFLAAQ